MKQFFRGTAFKCITVLLSIVLLCSIFLTICDSLFYVSPEERLTRAIAKIYQGEAVITESVSTPNLNLQLEKSTIHEIRIVVSDNHAGDYLVKSEGKNGYQNGTVTCWIVIQTNEENTIKGIGNVVIDSNTNQSYISKVTEDYLKKFSSTYHGAAFSTDDGFIAGGASYSSNAICNAVNGALEFVRSYLETTEETV